MSDSSDIESLVYRPQFDAPQVISAIQLPLIDDSPNQAPNSMQDKTTIIHMTKQSTEDLQKLQTECQEIPQPTPLNDAPSEVNQIQAEHHQQQQLSPKEHNLQFMTASLPASPKAEQKKKESKPDPLAVQMILEQKLQRYFVEQLRFYRGEVDQQLQGQFAELKREQLPIIQKEVQAKLGSLDFGQWQKAWDEVQKLENVSAEEIANIVKKELGAKFKQLLAQDQTSRQAAEKRADIAAKLKGVNAELKANSTKLQELKKVWK